MQNPFRHEDQRGRPDHDDRMSQGGDGRGQRPDEYRTWGGGDGGRSAEAFRGQGREHGHESYRQSSADSGWGYGQNQQSRYGQGMSTPYSGDRGSSGPYGPGGYQQGSQAGGGGQSGQGYGSQGYGQGQGSMGQGSMGYGGMGGQPFDQGGYGAQMNQGYGSQNYGGQSGMSQNYASHGYAPGSQIWEGSGRGMGGQTHEHHDFEPDYLHWRQQQLSAFDQDYKSWRDERRQKFSSDFDSWRQNRPRSEASGEHHTPAENPIVGDVSDGGVGSAADAKKR